MTPCLAIVTMIQTFGERVNPHPHLHALVSRGGWMASGERIPVPYVDPKAAEEEGQRLMQAASDIFLGWIRGDEEGHDYYVRQMWDMKGSVDFGSLTPQELREYATACGWTLAHAHCRTGSASAILATWARTSRSTGRSEDSPLPMRIWQRPITLSSNPSLLDRPSISIVSTLASQTSREPATQAFEGTLCAVS